MKGTVVRRLVHCALTAVAVWLVGCSSLDPRPEHLPYALYDSPLIAGSPSDSRLSRMQASGGASGGGSTSDSEHPEQRTSKNSPETEGARERSETVNRPDLSTEAPAPAGASDDTISHEEASERTPPPSSKKADPGVTADAHRDAARYVAATYELNGVQLPETAHRNIPKLYRRCRESDATFQSREPAAGDLAFFHNVKDANGDGRNNDWYTYVALVENIDSSGTVTLLGYRDGEVRKFRMDLSKPDKQTGPTGDVINTKLRPERSDDPPYTQYLAGELFAGYCGLLGDKSELLVVDNWQPGMELEPPQ